MNQTQSRGANGRFLPTTSPLEARIAELEAQVVQLQTSNAWNAAESVRLAEEKRLSEQGRDAAIEKFRVEQDAAVRHAREFIRLGEENGALREELQHANLKLDNRKEDIQALQAQVEELSQENTRLQSLPVPEESPLLPLWVRIIFGGIVFFIIAYFAHRAGFDAAMEMGR